MTEPVLVDLDDFREDCSRLELLDEIKQEIPGFRATLFTIPGRCSTGFIADVQASRRWLDLVPHGRHHDTARECQDWTRADAGGYCDAIEADGKLTRGFKAPGWQISQATLDVLFERDWWVADQHYNDLRRPINMKVYLLDGPDRIHGHLGHLGGHNANELAYLLQPIMLRQNRDFGFVKDFVRRWDGPKA